MMRKVITILIMVMPMVMARTMTIMVRMVTRCIAQVGGFVTRSVTSLSAALPLPRGPRKFLRRYHNSQMIGLTATVWVAEVGGFVTNFCHPFSVFAAIKKVTRYV